SPNPCVTFSTVRSEIAASSLIQAVRNRTARKTSVRSAASGRGILDGEGGSETGNGTSSTKIVGGSVGPSQTSLKRYGSVEEEEISAAATEPRVHHIIEDRSKRVRDAEVDEVLIARRELALAYEDFLGRGFAAGKVDLVAGTRQIREDV